MHKMFKIVKVCQRNVIKILDYFNPRIYMRQYNAYLESIGVKLLGKPLYIHPTAYLDGKDYGLITLEENVVISRNVTLLTHDYSIAAGFRANGDDLSHEAYYLEPIKVGRNSFIGANAVILPGSVIGPDCIIGAGAVVKGEIASNSIIIGNPAKVVGTTKEWAVKKRALGGYKIQQTK